MKILFASADRDLLSTYEKILKIRGWDVYTAFDGAQVMNTDHTGASVAVIDEKLPRVPCGKLIKLFCDKGIPVIVLTYKNGCGEKSAKSLPFPFTPNDLTEIIDGLCQSGKNGQDGETDE